ncbi:LytTR family DNA-binding domain-containing protein [Lachnospiraceae bacterium 45-W7]
MRISICDDDENELMDVTLCTEKYFNNTKISVQIVKFQKAVSLLSYEESHGASDIYVLDVIMPELDGIALGRILHEKNPDAFILYLTSSREFAIEAFTVKAFSYLLKPVSEPDLFHELDQLLEKVNQPKPQIQIRSKNGIQFVMLSDVTAVEYFNHHLVYYTTGGAVEGFQQREAFDVSVSEFLKSGCFLKVSASHIINAGHIKSVDGDNFIMDDGSVYKITRRFSDAKKKYLDFIIGGE